MNDSELPADDDIAPAAMVARRPVYLVCAFLGLFAVISLGRFACQAAEAFSSDDFHAVTAKHWLNLLALLLQGICFALLAGRLATAYAATGTTGAFLSKLNGFWQFTAMVLGALAIATILQAASVYYLDKLEGQERASEDFVRNVRTPFPANRLELRLAQKEPRDGFLEMQHAFMPQKFFVESKALISGDEIESAEVEVSSFMNPGEDRVYVHLKLTKAGQDKLEKVSTEHRFQHFAVLVDGKLKATPILADRLVTKSVMLSGVFTLEEAWQLMRAGKP